MLVTLSNHNGGGNSKKKNATTLHVNHTFLYMTLPSLYDYDVAETS